VLVIGLCLTAFSSLAGDTVLNWLGVVSGALVTLVGANLLADAVRRSRPKPTLPHAPHPSPTPSASPPALVGAAGPANTAEPEHVTTASHASLAHPHPQANQDLPGHHAHHPADHPHDHPHDHAHTKTHRHGLFGHHHSHGPADTPTEPEPFTTRGLIGLGIAGGLVPSPSALVVLLGAIALGRTAFGATLVLAYGLGMAATLTAVGLLLVRLGNRVTRLDSYPLSRWVRRVTPYTALLTAALVLVVGLGLMIRGLPTVL
jgi:nickel/cobalt exporter